MNIAPTNLTGAVQSPYLPGTQIQYAWDSTSLGMFKTCPRLYQYVMLEGWGGKDESIHLRFGIEYHQALQEYDVSKFGGATHHEAMIVCVRNLLGRVHDWEVDEDTRAGKYKNRGSIVQLVIDYLDKFADDPAKTFVLEDGRPAVELSFRFELDWGPTAAQIDVEPEILKESSFSPQPYLLSGHLDRVVDFQSSLYVMDRKTSLSTIGTYFFDQFSPSNQMTLYTLASQIILGSPVKGVIIDAAQVLLEKPNNFERGFTYRTPDQLEEWMQDLTQLLSLAEHYATQGYWPMNDTACGNYGGCKFRKICSKSPQVREKLLAGSFTKLAPEDRWNPLKPR